MSNGHPPICDPACQKIILNSGNIFALIQVTRNGVRNSKPRPEAEADWDEICEICDRAESAAKAVEHGKNPAALSPEESASVIANLNHHENEVCRAQTIFLKAVGYDGPTGKMLE